MVNDLKSDKRKHAWLLCAIIVLSIVEFVMILLSVIAFVAVIPMGIIMFGLSGLLLWGIIALARKDKPIKERLREYKKSHPKEKPAPTKTEEPTEIKCNHCGEVYLSDKASCPHCAEPQPKKVDVEAEDRFNYRVNVIAHCVGISVGVFIFSLGVFFFVFSIFALIPAAICAVISVVLTLVYYKFEPENRKLITKQFLRDQKSICPVCGSHSIALGRKGYDWKKGFWYRIFNFKGGHYLAGIDSRRVTAHCQNCGHSWLTNEEWIR